MVQSDLRVKLVNEVLQGIRVVKFYNWEQSFVQRLSEARKARGVPHSAFFILFFGGCFAYEYQKEMFHSFHINLLKVELQLIKRLAQINALNSALMTTVKHSQYHLSLPIELDFVCLLKD